ncbi:CENP-meta [Carabus blaptoides fortunei]
MSDNIKVAIRVRPLIQREKIEKLREQWEVNQDCIFPVDIVTNKKNGDSYSFDHIFDSKCRNVEIYKTVVHPVVDAAINGFNGTIFAYGQTSSGKTYTMMGSLEEPGLISLAVENIFQTIERSANRKFLLRVSYLEIYNEKIYDLLDIGKSIKIHEDFNGVVVVNVKYIVTDTAEKVYNVMKKGNRARTIGETSMNEKSSRSHAIFQIIIESTDVKDNNGVVNVAQLNLVDLAGSERPTVTKATGLRLKEGAHINKSLSVLSLVMKQLSESSDFVNFRDSKLTRILQSSLGGNALTAIICAVTPASLDETHSTLAFASRAKTVKNKPHQNEVLTDEALITRYAIQVSKLKQELEKANVHNKNLQVGQHEQALANRRLKERIALLEKSVLTSSKTSGTSSNSKHRRRTWCPSTCSSNSSLPIIYESAILQTKDICDKDFSEISQNTSILDIDQLDIEEFPFDDCELDLIENEKFCLGTVLKDQTELSELCDDPETTPPQSPKQPPSSYELSERESVAKEPEEYVRWLVNASNTPESVLRQRAAYYESEFVSLIELTKTEKELLVNDQAIELESVKLELEQLKHVQDFERTVKENMELEFKEEKKDLYDKLNLLSRENVKLTQQVSRTQEKLNDTEFLIDLKMSKHKRREEELLTMLEEARASSQIPCKVVNVQSTNDINIETENFLVSIKSQLTLLRSEIDTGQPIDRILQVLNDIVKNCKSAVDDIHSDSEEVQEFFIAIKFMLEIFSNALTNDNMLQEMESERVRMLNKLSHLQVAQHSFDVICREKNKEIATVLDQLAECNTKLQTYITTIKIQEDEYNTLQEVLKEKDKEIEDISDQIMNYIDQLADAEKELLQYRSVSMSEQSSQTTNNELAHPIEISECLTNATDNIEYTLVNQQKDLLIQELSDKLMNADSQLLKLEAEFNDFKINTTRLMAIEQKQISCQTETCSQTDDESEIVELKNKQITDLSAKMQEYETQLLCCESKLQLYETVITTEMAIQTDNYENEQIARKEIELKDMSDKMEEYVRQISAYENELKQCKERSGNDVESQTEDTETEIIQIKNNEIKLMKEQFKENCAQLTECEEKLKFYESISKTETECQTEYYENEITVLLNKQLLDQSAKVVEYKLEVATYKDKLKKYEDCTQTENYTQTEDYDHDYLPMIKVETSPQIDDYESDKIEYKNQQIELLSNKLQQPVEQISINETLLKQQMELSKEETNELHRELQNISEQLNYTNKKTVVLKSHLKESSVLENSNRTEIEKLIKKQEQVEELTSNSDTTTTLVQSEHSEIERLNHELHDCKEKICLLESHLEKATSLLTSSISFGQISEYEECTPSSENSYLPSNDNSDLNQSLPVDDISQQLQGQLLKLKRMFEDSIKEHDAKAETSFTTMNTLLSQIETKFETNVVDIIMQKETQINNLLKSNSETQAQIQLKDVEIELLSEQRERYMNIVTKYEQEIEENKSAQNKCSLVAEEKDKEISLLTSQIQDQTNQLLAVDDKLKNLESSIHMYKTAVSTLKAKISIILTNYKDKMQHVCIDLNSFTSEPKTEENEDVQQADANIVDKESEIQAFSNAINYLCESLVNLNTAYEAQTMKLKNMESCTAEYNRMQERLNIELKEANDYVKRLKFKHNVLEKENSIHVTANEKLKEEINLLQNTIQMQGETNKACIEEFKRTITELEIEKGKLIHINTDISAKYDVSLQKNEDLSNEMKKISNALNEKIENTDNLIKELEAAKLVTDNTVQIEQLKKQSRLIKETLEKKIEKLSEKVTNYMTAINKLKNENIKLKYDMEHKNTYKQAMSKEIAELHAELEKRATAYELEKTMLLTKHESLETQNNKISKIVEYLQQKINEKDIDYSMLTNKLEVLNQENKCLKVTVTQLNDEVNTWKNKVNATAAIMKATEEDRDSCKKMIHSLENSLGDVQYELHELKYKDKVKQKRIQRQSLQDSSRSLSSGDIDESTGSDSTCRCKEYAIEVNQYKVRIDLIESQLAATNKEMTQYRDPGAYSRKIDCKRCKQRGFTLDKQTQTTHLDSDTNTGPSTSRGMDNQETELKQLRKKNEHLKELCKFRKIKLDQLQKQIDSLTSN